MEILSDRNIEFSACNNPLVKVLGRIELDDIETRLAEHLGVGDATVAALADDTNDAKETKGAAIEIRGSATQANPLFFVPTGTGDHSYASLLAQHLRTDGPVYALPSHDQKKEFLQTVEAADRYLR